MINDYFCLKFSTNYRCKTQNWTHWTFILYLNILTTHFSNVSLQWNLKSVGNSFKPFDWPGSNTIQNETIYTISRIENGTCHHKQWHFYISIIIFLVSSCLAASISSSSKAAKYDWRFGDPSFMNKIKSTKKKKKSSLEPKAIIIIIHREECICM